MKVIFLDIDGVLNCEEAYVNGFCKYKEINLTEGKKDHYQEFYSPSKLWLNRLIKETNAKIVISSSWRKSGLGFMKDVWKEEGMEGEIIDTTPSLYLQKGGSIVFHNNKLSEHPTPQVRGYSIPRGCEIEYWLKDKGYYDISWSKEEQQKVIKESGIENYIIIDDDSDMLYSQRNRFVNVLPSPRNKKGFTEEHYKLAIKILNNELDR